MKVKAGFRYLIFYPLSQIWSLVYRIRRFLYNYGVFKRVEFRIPVISVGNLTFGGSGKTPLTLWIANLVGENNKKPMILSRGYKGKLEHKVGILHCGDKIHGDPLEFGDEPVLLAKRLSTGSIVVGKNRVANFLFHFDRERPDVVILDDGFQHLKINGLLNIVIFDLSLPLEMYKTAPLGYMREGFSALVEADLIVFNRVDSSTRFKINSLKNKLKPFLASNVQYVEMDYTSKGIVRMDGKETIGDRSSNGFACVCISGIANPNSFYTMLEDFSGKIVKKISFPDHHIYNLEEIENILVVAKKLGAVVLTTEKDIVKLRKIINSELIYYLPIDLKFINGEKNLRDAILKCLQIY